MAQLEMWEEIEAVDFAEEEEDIAGEKWQELEEILVSSHQDRANFIQ